MRKRLIVGVSLGLLCFASSCGLGSHVSSQTAASCLSSSSPSDTSFDIDTGDVLSSEEIEMSSPGSVSISENESDAYDTIIIGFPGSADGSLFVSSNDIVEVDLDNSTNFYFEDSQLFIEKKGRFSFTVSSFIKDVSFHVTSDLNITTAKIGMVNKHGICAFYDPAVNDSVLSVVYKDSLNVNHVIVEALDKMVVNSIHMTRK